MRRAFIVAACVMTCGCTKHQIDVDAKDRITVCGTVQGFNGAPVAKALIELHVRATDTQDDPVANRFEVSRTGDDGHFVLRSGYERRQYWLSINSARGCEGLNLRDLESKRLPVTFQRSASEGDCDSRINLVVDDHCDLKLY